MYKSVIVTLLAAAILQGCQTTPLKSGAGALSRADVERLFVGNTVESYNLNTKFTSFTYYHPDGRAIQERLWTKRLGKWSIRDDGMICLSFNKKPPKCRHIVKRDDTYYKVRPDESGNEERLVRYRYFVAGNALAKH